jgi:hypothetical protein
MDDWRKIPETLAIRVSMMGAYSPDWSLQFHAPAVGLPVYRITLDDDHTEWYHDPIRAIDEAIVIARKRR